MITSDDVHAGAAAEERAIKAILRAAWPGWFFIAAFSLAWFLFRWDGGLAWVIFLSSVWVLAHFTFNTKLRALAVEARDAIADRLPRPKEKLEAVAAWGGVAGVEDPETAGPKRRFKLRDLSPLAALAAVLVGLYVLANFKQLFQPSGAEIAAHYQAQTRAAENATSQASTEQAERTVVYVERHAAELAQLQREVTDARQAIAEAPDLDARVAAAREFYDGVRARTEAARAAALRGDDPGLVS